MEDVRQGRRKGRNSAFRFQSEGVLAGVKSTAQMRATREPGDNLRRGLTDCRASCDLPIERMEVPDARTTAEFFYQRVGHHCYRTGQAARRISHTSHGAHGTRVR
jgi:hypothetical protein